VKKLFVVVILSLFLVPVCLADGEVSVLVIDSGTDFSHQLLDPAADPNLAELNGEEGIDDSGSGYIDDLYGWNFPNDNHVLCNLEYTPPRYDDVIKFMELLAIFQEVGRDGMDPADFKILVKLYNDKELQPWINFTGGWAHGTHVAGIVANENTSVRVKALAHLPSGEPPAKQAEKQAEEALRHFNVQYRSIRTPRGRALEDNPLLPQLIEYFKQNGQQAAAAIEPEARYIGSLQPDIINNSWGSPNGNLCKVFKQNMIQHWGFKDPTDEEVQELVNLYATHALMPQTEVLFKYIPDALIVFAAGNSTENHTGKVNSPSDVSYTNKLVVAATNKDIAIADFSDYGVEQVDLAVPGVGIVSSVPNGKVCPMSGTSMAAPLATRYASLVLAENKYLSPQDLKSILMETVDKKSWLADKVVSGGVINIERAKLAANLIKEGMPLEEACLKARQEVVDVLPDTMRGARPPRFDSEFEKELYNSGVW